MYPVCTVGGLTNTAGAILGRRSAEAETHLEMGMKMEDDIVTTTRGETSSLVPVVQGTLDDILQDETLNEQFGGKDGKLSPSQAGLAAAVTVMMQDRLLAQAQHAHQRELTLISGFWKLYKTPVLRLGSAIDQPVAAPSSSRPHRSRLAGLFSWGNLIGGAAIVLVATSFYYTKLTANYEQQWKNAETNASSL